MAKKSIEFKNIRVVAAAIVAIAAIAVVLMWMRTCVGSAAVETERTLSIRAAEDHALLNAGDALKRMSMIDRAEAEAIAAEVVSDLAGSNHLRLSQSRLRSLEKLVANRLAMYAEPDYTEYQSRIPSDRSSETAEPFVFDDKAAWESSARIIAEADVAVDSVFARPRIVGGVERDLPSGGVMSYFDGVGVYSDIGLSPNSDVIDVYIPVHMQNDRIRDARLFLILSFVWDPNQQDWAPWGASYYDPSQTLQSMPIPWF